MSSREPLWFCHECNAEMRPLMAPDPVCASCRGTFVEKMENPQDDPREFHRHTLGDGDAAPIPPALEQLFGIFQGLAAPPRSPASPSNRGGESNRHNSPFRFQFSNGSTSRTISFGGGTQRTGANDMTMNDFLQEPIGGDGAGRRGGITGPLMAQYLMALLGRDPMMGGMGGFGGMDSAEHGRMGDYVFNQEALDGIISQIMENSNAHRPVPATEDIIGKLPRDVLEVGSPLLEKDCAVCKEQFKVETEDPDELVVVTLPCKHPFHAPCILPWLKSSGTCPVCRHALIPQPEHHPTNPSPGSSGDEARRPSNSDSPPTSGNNSAGGLLHAIFGTPPSGTGSSTTQRPSSQRRNSDGSLNIPGRWEGDDFH